MYEACCPNCRHANIIAYAHMSAHQSTHELLCGPLPKALEICVSKSRSQLSGSGDFWKQVARGCNLQKSASVHENVETQMESTDFACQEEEVKAFTMHKHGLSFWTSEDLRL